MTEEMLFPSYLNQGSRGPAVALLQAMLIAGGWGSLENPITISGIYDGATVEAVKGLQESFPDLEVDGNFGPKTRAAFQEETGLDVNQILANLFVGETRAVVPAGMPPAE